jgi:hypothetical protein
MPFPTSVVAAAGHLFSQPITAFEKDKITTDSGETSNARLPNRQITGVIQPLTELDTAITDDGSISNKGFLTIDTTYELFVFDGTNISGSTLQSYVIYENREWKVTKRDDLRDKSSGFNRYILGTYLDTGTI